MSVTPPERCVEAADPLHEAPIDCEVRPGANARDGTGRADCRPDACRGRRHAVPAKPSTKSVYRSIVVKVDERGRWHDPSHAPDLCAPPNSMLHAA